MSITINHISELVAPNEVPLECPTGVVHAAVAMVFRTSGDLLELLFIERAKYPDDPWSGNIGFPGGKVEASDGSPRSAAERETLEELGLDLSSPDYLGYLGAVTGAYLPVHVSCFVYRLPATPSLTLSEEIVDAFWVPLPELVPPTRHCTVPIPFRGEDVPRPGIRLPQPEKPFLWGITYRLVMELLRQLGCDQGTAGKATVTFTR